MGAWFSRNRKKQSSPRTPTQKQQQSKPQSSSAPSSASISQQASPILTSQLPNRQNSITTTYHNSVPPSPTTAGGAAAVLASSHPYAPSAASAPATPIIIPSVKQNASLPTIPTLTSPLNGRVIHSNRVSATSNDDSADNSLDEHNSGSSSPIITDVVDSHQVNTNSNNNHHPDSYRQINLDMIKPFQVATGDAAYSFWDRDKTYRPEKGYNHRNAKLGHTIKATMKATLGGGDLLSTVKLPEGEDYNEWIAVNTVHFYNAASMIYGTCSQFCTEQTCPTMSAGKCEWLWLNPPEYKKPTRLSAPQYIDLTLQWVDEQISDTSIFPVDEYSKFKRNFIPIIKNIYKRLFRLYAHLYYNHAEKIRNIGANAHLNTCFKHFIYFVLEFNLMDKNELMPLDKLIMKMKENDEMKRGRGY